MAMANLRSPAINSSSPATPIQPSFCIHHKKKKKNNTEEEKKKTKATGCWNVVTRSHESFESEVSIRRRR